MKCNAWVTRAVGITGRKDTLSPCLVTTHRTSSSFRANSESDFSFGLQQVLTGCSPLSRNFIISFHLGSSSWYSLNSLGEKLSQDDCFWVDWWIRWLVVNIWGVL